MPTTSQMFDIWENELNFPSMRRYDDPMYVKPSMDFNNSKPFTGKAIGHIETDEKTGDVKIVVDKEVLINL